MRIGMKWRMLGVVATTTLAALAAGAACGAPVLGVSRSLVDWGFVEFSQGNDVQAVYLTNTGDAPLTLTGITLQGAPDFSVAGTCVSALVLGPAGRCRLEFGVALANQSAGAISATATIAADSTPSAQIQLSAFNVGTQLAGYQPPDFIPDWIDFAGQTVGVAAAAQTFTIRNGGTFPYAMRALSLAGGDSADFTLGTDCIGRTLAVGDSCNAIVGFLPSVEGPRSTELRLDFHVSATTTRSITGFAYPLTDAAAPVSVVEYYNASLDHYFITWVTAEQAHLDAGLTPTRWIRTGHSFKAYITPQTDSSEVCRYYIPPALGDSHFFGRGAAECAATGMAHPSFVLEDPRFMQLYLPAAGNCPTGTAPIYRVFDNRVDVNHRYTAERAVRDQMVAKGWIAEGDGPDLVVMCAPT